MNFIQSSQEGILDQLPALGLTEFLVPNIKHAIATVAMSATVACASAGALAQGASGEDIAKGAGLGAAIGWVAATLARTGATGPAVVGAVIGAVATDMNKSSGAKPPPGEGGAQQRLPNSPPFARRELGSHRLAQFHALATKFNTTHSAAVAAQEARQADELDSSLSTGGQISNRAALVVAERHANAERNQVGRQFLVGYAKATDMGYDMTPMEGTASHIFNVMKVADPVPYSIIQASSSGYSSRTTATRGYRVR